MPKYLIHNPCDMDHYRDSWSEAVEKFEEILSFYRGDAPIDGWPEEIADLCIAQVVAETEEFDREDKPNDLDEEGISESTGEYWDSDWDSKANYRLKSVRIPWLPEDLVERIQTIIEHDNRAKSNSIGSDLLRDILNAVKEGE